ncbi:MAG: EAL domain-containing protein [Pseudolabrys sp.]|nr:EAL domain-containing protein [Pseudolabrys sp.]
MQTILLCLTTQHDWRLAGLAVAVCVLASFTAIAIYRKACADKGPARWLWLGVGAAASGFGIWSTHFIAMLAYLPGVDSGFDLGPTIGSLIVALAFAFLGQGTALVGRSRLASLVGGGLAGLGISAMHYMGMMALTVPGRLDWSGGLIATSSVFGVLLGAAALWVANTWRKVEGFIAASLIFAGAVLTTHFLGMAAATFVPDPTVAIENTGLTAPAMSLIISAGAAVVLAACLVLSIIDWKNRERLRLQKVQLDTALGSITQGICMYDADGKVTLFNERYSEITGVPPDKLTATDLVDIVQHPRSGIQVDDAASFASHVVDAAKQGRSLNDVLHRKDGRIVRAITHPVSSGGWVVTLDDITDRQRAQAEIAHMARHDGLTGLPNRTLFNERLAAALLRVSRGDRVGVFLIDLDRFKPINDTMGHSAGDALLKEVAARLSCCLRESDTVARLGGDEFAIIQAGNGLTAADTTTLAERLIEAVTAPFAISGQDVGIGASIGISFAPEDGNEAETLLRKADIAMYRAKADGRGAYRFFEAGMDAQAHARRVIETELRTALAKGELEIHYQPIHDSRTRWVVAFEALLRWNHPLRGLLMPDQFISIAEQTGLIRDIGDWVLKTACREAESWSRPVHIAVNLSPVQFRSRSLVSTVKAALAESGLAPQRLELEITEAVLLQDNEMTLGILHELREIGVLISMDDFGTGYSSLGYLRSFPFDKIKIDRSFVRDIASRADAMAIVRAVTGLSRSLGIPTTAEGVETFEQAELLRTEGCTQVQGFYFSEGRPAKEVEDILAAGNASDVSGAAAVEAHRRSRARRLQG